MTPRHSKSLLAGSWMKDASRIRPLVLIFHTINILSVKVYFPQLNSDCSATVTSSLSLHCLIWFLLLLSLVFLSLAALVY